jgi:hypothetical protein
MFLTILKYDTIRFRVHVSTQKDYFPVLMHALYYVNFLSTIKYTRMWLQLCVCVCVCVYSISYKLKFNSDLG